MPSSNLPNGGGSMDVSFSRDGFTFSSQPQVRFKVLRDNHPLLQWREGWAAGILVVSALLFPSRKHFNFYFKCINYPSKKRKATEKFSHGQEPTPKAFSLLNHDIVSRCVISMSIISSFLTPSSKIIELWPPQACWWTKGNGAHVDYLHPERKLWFNTPGLKLPAATPLPRDTVSPLLPARGIRGLMGFRVENPSSARGVCNTGLCRERGREPGLFFTSSLMQDPPHFSYPGVEGEMVVL